MLNFCVREPQVGEDALKKYERWSDVDINNEDADWVMEYGLIKNEPLDWHKIKSQVFEAQAKSEDIYKKVFFEENNLTSK